MTDYQLLAAKIHHCPSGLHQYFPTIHSLLQRQLHSINPKLFTQYSKSFENASFQFTCNISVEVNNHSFIFHKINAQRSFCKHANINYLLSITSNPNPLLMIAFHIKARSFSYDSPLFWNTLFSCAASIFRNSGLWNLTAEDV